MQSQLFDAPVKSKPRQRFGAQFKLVRLHDAPFPADVMETPDQAVQFWRQNVECADAFSFDRENMVVMFLNTRKRITGWELYSIGTMDTILVDNGNIFRAAIVAGAKGVIFAHNHPSGDPTPSEADIKVTRELIRAGQLLRVEVTDHIVLGRPAPERPKGHVSLRESGYFY